MLRNPNYLYGEGVVSVPPHLNFAKYMIDALWSYNDKVAMINGHTHEKLTYRELAKDSMNVAISLTRIGVGKGDTIAICSENRQEYFSTVIGIMCTGAVVTAANVAYTKGELQHVLGISKPKIIFCSPLAYKNHATTLKTLSYIKTVILFDKERSIDTLSYEDLVKSDGENDISLDKFDVVDVTGQIDTALILYSSGTTGLPKGVMLTHLNILTTCQVPTTLDPDSISLSVTPWYHTMGLMGMFRIFCYGGTGVYLAKFDVDLYMLTIQMYKIVQITVAPPILVAVCKSEANYDVSSIRLVYSGAAPLRDDTIKAVKVRFPNVEAVFQGYGMTEVTLAVTRDTYLDVGTTKVGGVGRIVPGSLAKIVQITVAPPILVAVCKSEANYDVSSIRLVYSGAAPLRDDTIKAVKVVDVETRRVLGPNQPGEICLKGPTIMKGYVDKDISTDFDEEGFFKTGDIGYYDKDKYFFIVDRLKELIKYKGYQVAPAEIESVLLQHPGIRDAGVVGVPNEISGEVPRAFVVLQAGYDLTEDDVKAFVASKLSNPKHIRGGVRFVDEIPKNPSGKILRKHLRQMTEKKSKL